MSSTSSPDPNGAAGGGPDSETRRQDRPRQLPKDRETAGPQRRAAAANTPPAARHSASDRPKVKRIAHTPPGPGPLPERRGDEQPDPHTSLTEKVDGGEEITVPGGRQESGERDLHDEEWRAHDRHGPYGQRRRRRN
ncbi:hypothetical protein ACIRPT_12900 [Streptomyces sp. NPDC101227]|uniref:hypothetical protein n=1 Tax=Streptomyces sp. NPDC101227 TaxID=3366136 RepID=UPI00382EB8E9